MPFAAACQVAVGDSAVAATPVEISKLKLKESAINIACGASEFRNSVWWVMVACLFLS